MKLCESPDFKDAITAAPNHFSSQGLTEQFIEKDYFALYYILVEMTQ
jgi:hypothetical protein